MAENQEKDLANTVDNMDNSPEGQEIPVNIEGTEEKASGSGEKKSSSKKKSSSSSKKPRKTIKGLEMELKAQSEIIDELNAKAKDAEAKIAAAEEAAATANDKYQRLMAEFENMRKRTEKETAHMYDVGAKEVLEKLLPVIDNFERAQMAVTEEQKDDPFVQGVDRIYKQMLDYLTSVKVAPMNAEGQEFDPELHNAVMHIEDDMYNDNVVVEELQKGYMYKEEVLRHSMVKVAN